MLPTWLKQPYEDCELLAYDDGQQLAFFRLKDEVHSIAYTYLNLCDDDAWPQLMAVVTRFGKRVSPTHSVAQAQ